MLYIGPRSSLNIANSTIADNSANNSGGGIFLLIGCFGNICGDTEANLTNVTVVNNSAASGGGIFEPTAH